MMSPRPPGAPTRAPSGTVATTNTAAVRMPANSSGRPSRTSTSSRIALVLFAVVFFRLWYLQVLSGDQYVSQANQNQVREVRIQAPRGDIVDRNGAKVVVNR